MAIPPVALERISLVRHVGQKTIVNINGTDYEFTVQIKTGDTWTDVTRDGNRDWAEQANLVAQICKQVGGTASFTRATLETTGAIPNAADNTRIAEPVFHSVKIDHNGNDGQIESKTVNAAELDEGKQKTVRNQMNAIALTSLIHSCKSLEEDKVTEYMREHLDARNSKLSGLLKGYIYHRDHKAWENSDKTLPEPGKEKITIADGITYEAAEYGDYRFDSMDLKAFLTENKQTIIEHALNQE